MEAQWASDRSLASREAVAERGPMCRRRRKPPLHRLGSSVQVPTLCSAPAGWMPKRPNRCGNLHKRPAGPATMAPRGRGIRCLPPPVRPSRPLRSKGAETSSPRPPSRSLGARWKPGRSVASVACKHSRCRCYPSVAAGSASARSSDSQESTTRRSRVRKAAGNQPKGNRRPARELNRPTFCFYRAVSSGRIHATRRAGVTLKRELHPPQPSFASESGDPSNSRLFRERAKIG